VLFVFRTKKKRDRTAFRFPLQNRNGNSVLFQFIAISLLEFIPPSRIMAEPFAEFRGGRDVLEPQIKRGLSAFYRGSAGGQLLRAQSLGGSPGNAISMRITATMATGRIGK
jgi:hypothetical protein